MKLSVSEARRKLTQVLENLPVEGVSLTKRGKPVARLLPIEPIASGKPTKERKKGRLVTGPLIRGRGKPGPFMPTTVTPYDLIFD